MNFYQYASMCPPNATDPLGLTDQALLDYLKAGSYAPPTTAQLAGSIYLLKGGGAFGDQKWPLAASFLAHALLPTTIADPEHADVDHKDGDAAVNALLGDATFKSNIENGLKSGYLNSAASGLSCRSPKTTVNIPITPVAMNFTSGDLHYALGHVVFNMSGSCDVIMTCKDGCCSSVAYSCSLSIKGKDRYDFEWDPSGAGAGAAGAGGGCGGGGGGTVVNNAAYVAQQNGKLGNYYNTFNFKDQTSGSLDCPKKK